MFTTAAAASAGRTVEPDLPALRLAQSDKRSLLEKRMHASVSLITLRHHVTWNHMESHGVSVTQGVPRIHHTRLAPKMAHLDQQSVAL